MLQRIKPYDGSENYIFISYSHKDRDRVLEVLSYLDGQNVRFWYDEGIDPGTEWDENIASHIDHCSGFIAFMSDNYIASTNCKDELKYAINQEKEHLLLYLEKAELSPGLAMRTDMRQALNKYEFSSEQMDIFFDKLMEAPLIAPCRATVSSEILTVKTYEPSEVPAISETIMQNHCKKFSVGIEFRHDITVGYTASIAFGDNNIRLADESIELFTGGKEIDDKGIHTLLTQVQLKIFEIKDSYFPNADENPHISMILPSSFTKAQKDYVLEECRALNLSAELVKPCHAVLCSQAKVTDQKKAAVLYMRGHCCDMAVYDMMSGICHIKASSVIKNFSGISFMPGEEWAYIKKSFLTVIEKSGIYLDEIDCVYAGGDIIEEPDLFYDLTNEFPNAAAVPDHSIAWGTVRYYKMQTDMPTFLILKEVPYSIGLKNSKGRYFPIAAKGTTFPTSSPLTKQIIYLTEADNQPVFDITLYRGENSHAENNEKLGEFQFGSIRSANAGTPRIQITFAMDEDENITVSAHDMSSDRAWPNMGEHFLASSLEE